MGMNWYQQCEALRAKENDVQGICKEKILFGKNNIWGNILELCLDGKMIFCFVFYIPFEQLVLFIKNDVINILLI